MKKTVIERNVKINASKQKVWDVLADFGNVQNLSPNIKKSYLTSEDSVGLGSTRHCDFYSMGASVNEKIIEWNEGSSLRIELFEPKNLPMMQGMQALFEISVLENETTLKGIFEYQMSNVVGDFLNSIKMRKMNIKSWEQFMAGIKYNVETNEDVNNKTKLDLTMVEE